MKNLKIGIFGDSYSFDPKQSGNHSWPALLFTESNSYSYNYSHPGSSPWWSYEQFLTHRVHYDVIIFCYSNYTRWPVLPEHLTGKAFFTPHFSELEEMKKYTDVYFDIFSDKLLKFTYENIFRSVNEICKQEGRYLINLQTTEDLKSNFDFPNYYGLHFIAVNEKTYFNGKPITLCELHTTHGVPDNRKCHLTKSNNLRLFEFIKKAISERPSKVNLDLYREFSWTEFEN